MSPSTLAVQDVPPDGSRDNRLDFTEVKGFPLAHLCRESKDEFKLAEAGGNRPKYEVADIFRLYGEEYRANHCLSAEQSQVMRDIEGCRTSEMGTHWDVCDMCGHREKAYCSCHNRHCPKCNGIAKRVWVANRLKDLLPVDYFHVVFTLPDDQLHLLYLYNRKLIYDLLFDSASRTLLVFGQDPKWLGGLMGFFGVLHTWGQTLSLHPHIHFVVAGGGVGEGGEWVWGKNGDKFLFPVKGLSKRFRMLFVQGLKEAYEAGRVELPEECGQLGEARGFNRWLRALGHKEFVVYCKPPLGGPEGVVGYVGRYTHRVAISNHRIISIEEGRIRFSYKDYRAGNDEVSYEWKEMSLSADEFIRRFLNHVLPKGFHKIRHYGFLSNGNKGLLEQMRWHLLLEEEIVPKKIQREDEYVDEDELRVTCPVCKVGKMLPVFICHRFGTLVIMNICYLRMCEDSS